MKPHNIAEYLIEKYEKDGVEIQPSIGQVVIYYSKMVDGRKVARSTAVAYEALHQMHNLDYVIQTLIEDMKYSIDIELEIYDTNARRRTFSERLRDPFFT